MGVREKNKNAANHQTGTWRILRVDGSDTLIFSKPTIGKIEEAIGASCLDTVTLDRAANQIMMIDDNGIAAGKAVNAEATKLYHAICRPGTTH